MGDIISDVLLQWLLFRCHMNVYRFPWMLLGFKSICYVSQQGILHNWGGVCQQPKRNFQKNAQ